MRTRPVRRPQLSGRTERPSIQPTHQETPITTQPFDPSAFAVTLTLGDKTTISCRLDEVVEKAPPTDVYIESMSIDLTSHTDLINVMLTLDPLAIDEDSYFYINGFPVEAARTPEGGWCWVPSGGLRCERVDHRYIEWDGFPSSEVYETIYRFENLYWTSCSGDLWEEELIRTVCVGLFDNEADGIAAAVAASNFYYFTPDGTLANRLDNWDELEAAEIGRAHV